MQHSKPAHPSTCGDPAAALQGLSVLVVEDDPLVAQALKEGLERLGCIVLGPAHTVASAMSFAGCSAIDLALLDVNLGGASEVRIADLLVERDIEFIFLSGYDPETLPERFQARPFVRKPHRLADLAYAMVDVMSDRADRSNP